MEDNNKNVYIGDMPYNFNAREELTIQIPIIICQLMIYRIVYLANDISQTAEKKIYLIMRLNVLTNCHLKLVLKNLINLQISIQKKFQKKTQN